MEETLIEGGESNREIEVAPALISVHPLRKSVAVAIGSQLRAYDLQGDVPANLVDDSGGNLHSDSIRAICYGAKGRLFASAGDDKLVKIWGTDSWHCTRTVCSEKRVSAVAISHNGLFVSFADKFGVVWVVRLDGDCNETNNKAAPIFAHYCSIITSLEFSPDGRFIISADRDFKIRVTVFPDEPLSGAHEIQSFCLGHTEFVSCIAFVSTSKFLQGLLLSGSGDSTVRLWDITSGSLLDTCEVAAEAGLLESNEKEDAFSPAVTDICATPDGSVVAVAIQSLQGVMLLSCDLSLKTLSVSKVVSMGEIFIPTSLGLSSTAEHLWMITGASNLPDLDDPSFARVRVISGLLKESPGSSQDDPIVLEDSKIPGGENLLEKLQGSVSIAKEEETLAAAAEAVKTAMLKQFEHPDFRRNRGAIRKKTRSTATNTALAAAQAETAAKHAASAVTSALDAAAEATASATAAQLVVRELQSLKQSLSTESQGLKEMISAAAEATASATAAQLVARELQSLKQSLSTEFQGLKEMISNLSDRIQGGGS